MGAIAVKTDVEMPSLGYDMDGGRIQAWLKDVGDHITRGDPIAVIETDKTTVEMEALISGNLAEIVCAAGSEVAVGATIAVIESDG